MDYFDSGEGELGSGISLILTKTILKVFVDEIRIYKNWNIFLKKNRPDRWTTEYLLIKSVGIIFSCIETKFDCDGFYRYIISKFCE